MKSKKKYIVAASLVIVISILGVGYRFMFSDSSHQVLDSGAECTNCHTDGKTTYDVTDPKGAFVSSDGVIAVTVKGADTVEICSVVFTAEDGSKYVPFVESSETAPYSGTLQDGIYAICATADGETVSKLLVVDSAATSDFDGTIELKL